MKYIVICYAIHNKEIIDYKSFDDEEDAYEFLEKDAKSTYENEYNNSSKKQIEFAIKNDGTAYLSSHDKKYQWTWEVIKIKR